MNERIRKLAGQAGFETEHHKWIFANDNVGEGECHELLEKFAELIVRECIDCVRGAGLTDEVAVKNNLGFNDGLSAAVVNVQKHFGVEE
jgi:hypothetical protein